MDCILVRVMMMMMMCRPMHTYYFKMFEWYFHSFNLIFSLISLFQLNAFRRLRSYKQGDLADIQDLNQGHIVDNYRPTLPLYDRKILCSFC